MDEMEPADQEFPIILTDLPEALAHERVEMIWLSDDALRAATRPDFTPEQQKRLATWNDFADDCPLTSAENRNWQNCWHSINAPYGGVRKPLLY